MTTKISARVGGLGIDARDKFEVQSNATVTIGNGTNTGNVIIGGSTTIGGATTMGGFTANGVAVFGSIEGTNLRNRIVYYAPFNQMYQQIGDGTFNTGGTLNFSRYLSADNIAVSMNTITYSMSVTGNLSIGTNSSNTFTVNGTFDLGAF